MEKNPSYLAAEVTNTSMNHQYAAILGSDDVKAKKKLDKCLRNYLIFNTNCLLKCKRVILLNTIMLVRRDY